MIEMYSSDKTVGEMLCVCVEEREKARKEIKVFNVPSVNPIDVYKTDVPVGEMLSAYVAERKSTREKMKVFNIPSFSQIQKLFNFGSLAAH